MPLRGPLQACLVPGTPQQAASQGRFRVLGRRLRIGNPELRKLYDEEVSVYRALLYCCPGKDSISWLPAAPTDCACPITDLDKFELKSSSHSQGVGWGSHPTVLHRGKRGGERLQPRIDGIHRDSAHTVGFPLNSCSHSPWNSRASILTPVNPVSNQQRFRQLSNVVCEGGAKQPRGGMSSKVGP